MNRRLIQISLILIFFLFGLLLTSVGAVTQLIINTFDVSRADAAILEPIKDIPIVLFAFIMGAYLSRFGLKRALLVALSLVSIGTFTMAAVQTFWATKILFALIGFSFGLAKIAGYSIIGLIEEKTHKHMSLMNFMEAFFMLGVLGSYTIFNVINSLPAAQQQNWTTIFWLFGGVSSCLLIVVWFVKIDESSLASGYSRKVGNQDFFSTLNLIANPMVGYFIAAIFTFVMLEQGIGLWLPTYNKEILKLTDAFSLDFISIIAWAAVIGRLIASIVVRFLSWFSFIKVILICSAVLMILTFPLTQNLTGSSVGGWQEAPLATYIFPLIYLLIAPIYPITSSVILTSLPLKEHSSMTGIIITFSALGSSIGALITALVFVQAESQMAFYLYLIPLIGLILFLRKMHINMIQRIVAADVG